MSFELVLFEFVEDGVVFDNNFPEPDKSVGFAGLLMHSLKRPLNPVTTGTGRLVVPVGYEDVERLFDECADFEIALTETLEASNKRQIQPQRPRMIKPLKDTNIITGPYKSIVLNNLILNPQQPPHRQQHHILEIIINDILIGADHQVGNLQNFNPNPVSVRDVFGVEVGVALDVQVARVQAQLDCLRHGFHYLLVFGDDRALGDVWRVDFG